LFAQLQGWWAPATITFRGGQVHALDRPVYLVSVLLCFTATLFLSATMASWIMYRFRMRVGELVTEHTQFMLKTAHNLRAPLSAGMSMLDLVQEGYMGPVTSKQQESFRKIDARLKALHQTIGELLTIAKARDRSREITDVVVDLKQLARQTEEIFRAEASRKRVSLQIVA
ncbi:MAG: HAMP domain-containing histidine kinase, partial [bacterium]|nr:HAMP domain-containing histidine kinase [bacterium]